MTELTTSDRLSSVIFSGSSYEKISLELAVLTPVLKSILSKKTLEDKESVFESHERFLSFFLRNPLCAKFLKNLTPSYRYLFKSLVVLGQEQLLSFQKVVSSKEKKKIEEMLEHLQKVEEFYKEEGGLAGYHCLCLKLILEQTEGVKKDLEWTYHPPVGIDLTQESEYVHEAIIQGIRAQGELAELYPVGGAADRLNLHDETTQIDLPAAKLEFLGKTLLEGMIRDLQAREYLHYKLFGQQVITPIALMTSMEKDNDFHIKSIIREHGYFGRSEGSFYFFLQPLVPTIDREGKWCLKAEFELLLKPGGHGVVWKLAVDSGAFKWLKEKGKTGLVIRQINNPLAGVDLGLLALVGVGKKEKKVCGFASCVRRIKTSEGMNVIKESRSKKGVRAVLSNVEYCDFKKYGIEDSAKEVDKPYSIFPSNTNIIYAQLEAIEKVIASHPYPGKLVNFKETAHYKEGEGIVLGDVARLELLMQNIADGLETDVPDQYLKNSLASLPTFITFNKRHKTISPTKKEFVPGSGLVETAVGCFYDYLKNIHELFADYCGWSLPPLPKEECFLKEGPSFIVRFHPALGPLYSIIKQKIISGSLALGSELELEIVDMFAQDLSVEGSLLIDAKQPLGHMHNGQLLFSSHTGRCILRHVKVLNQGIDHDYNNLYWRNRIERKESCRIILEGYSEFVAEHVLLKGDIEVIVKDGERVTAIQKGAHVEFIRESLSISEPSPKWEYHVEQDSTITLSYKE